MGGRRTWGRTGVSAWAVMHPMPAGCVVCRDYNTTVAIGGKTSEISLFLQVHPTTRKQAMLQFLWGR